MQPKKQSVWSITVVVMHLVQGSKDYIGGTLLLSLLTLESEAFGYI